VSIENGVPAERARCKNAPTTHRPREPVARIERIDCLFVPIWLIVGLSADAVELTTPAVECVRVGDV